MRRVTGAVLFFLGGISVGGDAGGGGGRPADRLDGGQGGQEADSHVLLAALRLRLHRHHRRPQRGDALRRARADGARQRRRLARRAGQTPRRATFCFLAARLFT